MSPVKDRYKDHNCRNLKVYQKTTKAFELRFTQDDCPLSIDGWTIYFTAKEKMDDLDTNAVIQKDITSHFDASGGKTLITLSSSDTDIQDKSYYYDIKYVDDQGESDIILHGRLLVSKPVTTRG